MSQQTEFQPLNGRAQTGHGATLPDRHHSDAGYQGISIITPDALVAFIDSLRQAGYNIGVSQYIAAQDLLVAIAAQGLQPQPQRLKTMLGPIMCSSADEQAEFQQRFDAWMHLLQTPRHARSHAVPPLEQELKQVERRSRRLRRVLVYASLVLMGLLSPFVIHHWRSGRSPQQLNSGESEAALTGLEQFMDDLRSIELVEFLMTNGWVALVLIIVIPAIALGIWRFWWQRQARRFLQRRATHQLPELDKLSIPDLGQSLFPPTLFMQIAHQLRRRVVIPSRELDIEKTIQASLQQGGWLTPVYGVRKVLPEYLFLIDRSSYRDHQARFVEEAIARLRGNGVFIDCYSFDGDPRVCFSYDFPDEEREPPRKLAELAAKYSQHRLLIFTETQQLFRADTGRIAPWTELLLKWRDRVVLTPKAIDQWGYQETELTEKFVVLPATVQGLQHLIRSLHHGKTTLPQEKVYSPPLPELLRLHPRRWIERTPPKPNEIYAMLLDLQRYLGAAGFYWLSACAVFPKLHWNLTVFLGNALTTESGSPLLNVSSITDLARLPWFRYGYMPDWFRRYLIATLTPNQEQAIRNNLRALLETVVLGGTNKGLELEIVHQHPNLISQLAKPLMHRLSKEAPHHSALKEYIFLSFMLERKKRTLAVEISREALRSFNQPNSAKKSLGSRNIDSSKIYQTSYSKFERFVQNYIEVLLEKTQQLLGHFKRIFRVICRQSKRAFQESSVVRWSSILGIVGLAIIALIIQLDWSNKFTYEFLFYIITYVVHYPLASIFCSKIYKRLGIEQAWLAWIPIFNIYISLSAAGVRSKKVWTIAIIFSYFLFLSIVQWVIVWPKICKKFGKSPLLALACLAPYIGPLFLFWHLSNSEPAFLKDSHPSANQAFDQHQWPL